MAAAVTAQRRRRQAFWAGVLLVGLALLLYLATLDNGLQPAELLGGDLITHQYAQVQARPSNAPGYPLYTMGGWAWFHGLHRILGLIGFSQPNPLPILSSYSTLWALLALGLLYAILCRLTRSPTQTAGNWPLAWLLSAFYAVTYFFWYYATTAEQYSSAIAQTLAIVFVYLVWRDAVALPLKDVRGTQRAPPQAWGAGGPRAAGLLILLAFLCGLSLAHMLTVAFIVPPIVIAVLWEQPRLLRNWRMIGLCVLTALLPLASYWYVWARGSTHPAWWGAGEWRNAQAWFWAFVSTAQGRDELSWGLAPGRALLGNGFPELIWQEVSLLFLVLGVGGIALLGRRTAFVLYGTLAIYLVFDWMYRYGNWFQVILPAYPLLLFGVAAVFDRWQQSVRQRRYAWLQYAPHVVLLVAIAWRFDASWPRTQSHNRPADTALDRAAVLLDQPLPQGANLFSSVEEALALDYLINIWGVRPDLQVVGSDQAGNRLEDGKIVLATFASASILLSELPASVAPALRTFSPDWLMLTQTRLAQPAVSPTVVTDREIAPDLRLQGYTVQPAPAGKPVTQTSQAVDVTLVWQVANAWPAGVGLSLRPMRQGAFIPDPARSDGAIVQVDASAPMQGLAPNAPLITDALRVPLPAGADGILLIVYRHQDDGFENLLELPLGIPPLSEP